MEELQSLLKEDTPQRRIIYHYTNFTGLYGIVANKCLWCTSIRFLNDKSEFEHAFSIAKEIIYSNTLKKRSKSELDKMKDYIEHPHRMFYFERDDTHFIVSFSDEPNLLSQWRAYCRDGGVSIGFDYETLKNFNNEKLYGSVKLYQCNYDDSKKIVRSSLNSLKEIDFYLLAEAIGKVAPFVKHKSFKEERERRIMIMNPRKVHFGPKQSLIIPYCELDLSGFTNLGIKEINIGPNINQELAKKSIESFLEWNKINVDQIQIENSKIPYRNYIN